MYVYIYKMYITLYMIHIYHIVLDLSQKAKKWYVYAPEMGRYEGIPSVRTEKCYFSLVLTHLTVVFGGSYRDLTARVLAATRTEVFSGDVEVARCHCSTVPSQSLCPVSLRGLSCSHGCVFLNAACTSPPVNGCGSV